MKKIGFLTLLLFVLMSCSTAFALTPLQSISKIVVSPEKITPDTDVTVTLTSTAPNIDHIDLWFSTSNGNADFYVTLKPTSNKLQYSGTNKIPSFIILGTWKLGQLTFYFTNGQKQMYAYPPLKAAGKAISFGSTSQFYEDNKDVIAPPPSSDSNESDTQLNTSASTTTTTTATSTTTVATANAKLSDIKGHWAQGSIQKLISKNFIKGYPDGYFKPNQSITRAEFIKILISAMKLTSSSSTSVFNDTKTHWAKNEIAIAKDRKITDGYKDGNFRPSAQITRAEIVSMLSNAKGFPAKSTSIKFSDVKNGHWAESAIYAAAANGIVSGYKGNLFKPNNAATRAEACSMIDSFLTFNKLY